MDTEKKMIPCGYRLCSITFPERSDKKFCCDKHRVAEYNLEHPRMPLQSSEQTKKREGMKLAAEHNPEMLATFRRIALHQASIKLVITIDDVREAAKRNGVQYSPSNWMGSVFTKSGGWRWTGEVKASTHEGAHGRMIKKWMRA